MKGFPIAHIFHPSIPPMHAVVNNHNRNIDYWTVKRKFAEIVSTNDVNKIYSISNELRRVLSAITALNFYQGDVPSVMIRIQPENMSPFIIDISTGEHDDYIIQTLDVGTFAPFGEQCTCSAVNKKELECIKETISKEGANKQVISSQADSLIKISRIWADFFPANTSNQPI
ncbi:hypothetical protein WDK05_18315, partial [Escherichia coli]